MEPNLNRTAVGSGWPRRAIAQGHAAVAAHSNRDHAGIVNSLRRRLNALERIVDPAWRQPYIAAVDKASALHRVEVSEFGVIAAHKDRLPAYCSRALPGSYAEGVNPAVERYTKHRCLRAREIKRISGAHKRDRLGVQLVVREIGHLSRASALVRSNMAQRVSSASNTAALRALRCRARPMPMSSRSDPHRRVASGGMTAVVVPQNRRSTPEEHVPGAAGYS
jgi:hypothetical protein